MIIAAAGIIFVIANLRMIPQLPASLVSHSVTAPVKVNRRSKLGDGCYHVFLDVGSNIGIHGRFLFEPQKYPDSTSSVATFDREFGSPRDNRLYCVFAFEPNPKFEQRHLDLEKAYRTLGWQYTFIKAGASNIDGNLTFYQSHLVNSTTENGFSALTSKTLYGTDASGRTVQILRLASWIQNEIEDRRIPMQYPKQIHEPKVVMKLDVEGLEFKVFPDLLTTGALCKNIHLMIGEFHYSPGNNNFYPFNVTEDGKNLLQNRKDGEALAKQMLRLLGISENCMTRVSLDDDEAYATDPHDLPSLG